MPAVLLLLELLVIPVRTDRAAARHCASGGVRYPHRKSRLHGAASRGRRRRARRDACRRRSRRSKHCCQSRESRSRDARVALVRCSMPHVEPHRRRADPSHRNEPNRTEQMRREEKTLITVMVYAIRLPMRNANIIR